MAGNTNVDFKSAATIQNAVKWSQLQDQYLFCLDLLDLSIHDRGVDEAIDRLEEMFADLLDIERLEGERRTQVELLEKARKAGLQYAIHVAEEEIEVLDCLTGNVKDRLRRRLGEG